MIAELMNELAVGKIPVLKNCWLERTKRIGIGAFNTARFHFLIRKRTSFYDKHPEHRKLVHKIIPKLAGGITMDFIPIDT